MKTKRTSGSLWSVDQPTYDEKQTAGCNALRARLQSIAILAVQAQDMDNGDPLADQLQTIADDLAVAIRLQDAISRDDVDTAYRIAKGGK